MSDGYHLLLLDHSNPWSWNTAPEKITEELSSNWLTKEEPGLKHALTKINVIVFV